MRRLPWLLPVVLAGCELTEVTVPTGEPVVIVQGVLSRTRSTQFVVVERSKTGAAQGQDDAFGQTVPPAAPRIPIEDARVTLTYEGDSPCGEPVVQLAARSDARGVFETDRLCPLLPGDVVSLRVVTPDGTVVTGRTRIAGASRASVRVSDDTAAFDFEEITVHRQRDTVRFSADPIVARGLEVEVYREDRQDDLVILLYSDSLGIALAGNLVNPFEGDSGEAFFNAGVAYLLTAAIADTNYYDFVRSRSDPLTGRGFINHLEGGIGVFGSVETRTWVLRFVDDITDAREGTYQLRGDLSGVPVDVTLELYLDPLRPGAFAAFVEGDWYEGVVRRSLDGHFGGPDNADHEFTAFMTVPVSGEDPLHVWELRGRWRPGGQTFTVAVAGYIDGVQSLTGTIESRQVAGPGGQ